jgi:hypothetical protein
MDDLDDQLLDQEEMNDLFSRPIGQDTYMTDPDLENGRNAHTALLPAKTHLFLFSRASWPG